MIVNSTKHVNLPNETYHGFWCGWVVTVPTLDGDLEFSVSHSSPTKDAIAVTIKVENNKFSFERIF